ncbi:hypothetical protein V6N13_027944 [Hibiscus sabdariffa]
MLKRRWMSNEERGPVLVSMFNPIGTVIAGLSFMQIARASATELALRRTTKNVQEPSSFGHVCYSPEVIQEGLMISL